MRGDKPIRRGKPPPAPDYRNRNLNNLFQDYKRDYKVELEDKAYFEWSVVVQPKHLPAGRRTERMEAAEPPQNPLESRWARHPCCGTACLGRRPVPRRPPEPERFGTILNPY